MEEALDNLGDPLSFFDLDEPKDCVFSSTTSPGTDSPSGVWLFLGDRESGDSDGDDSMDEDAELLIAVASCGGEWWVMVFSGDLGSDFLGLMLTGGERLME